MENLTQAGPAGTPPRTLKDVLDELAAAGFSEEVEACRRRMFAGQTEFIRALVGPDFIRKP